MYAVVHGDANHIVIMPLLTKFVVGFKATKSEDNIFWVVKWPIRGFMAVVGN
jgi:hypothetical protein